MNLLLVAWMLASPFYDSQTSGGGGTGNVVGPASSTTNAIAKYCNTTGATICNSGVTIDGSNSIVSSGSNLTLDGSAGSSIQSTGGITPFILYAGDSVGVNPRIEISTPGVNQETVKLVGNNIQFDTISGAVMGIFSDTFLGLTLENIQVEGSIYLGPTLFVDSGAGNQVVLRNLSLIDAPAETTIEAAIDTLANLTSIQGNTITVSGTSTINQNVSTTGTPSFSSVSVGNTGLVVGASTPFSDSTGTLTLQNIDALDATTETTIENAIDTISTLSITNTITAPVYTSQTVDNGNASGASPSIGLSLNAGTYQYIDLSTATGTVTLTLNNEVNGTSYVIRITQGSSTPLVAFAGGTFQWANGSTYVATAVDNAVDIVTCEYFNSIFYCSWGGNYS